MKLPFLNRTGELCLLKKTLQNKEPTLAVLYGRRRCGKSRLLQQLGIKNLVYYLADQSDQTLQIAGLARQLSPCLPGFDAGTYSSWSALFEAIHARTPRSKSTLLTLVLDEFPYLVAECAALPSLIQKMIDTRSMPFHLILAGSSQRMMRDAAFGESAPLYGRAREIIKVRPLNAGWITDALNLAGTDAVTGYAVWGGVPRYWELAAEYDDQEQAIQELVLNRDGILHQEPRRLLLDDLRTDVLPHSLLAVIGSGVHRISEIGARLGKPAINLLKPMDILMNLGLIKREIPFGEREKNSKKTLYSIADPFLRFWYRYVFPNMSLLEQELYDGILRQWQETKDQFIGGTWEELGRLSVPHLTISGKKWNMAKRWWGKNMSGLAQEIDIVAESLDGKAILVGEAKWGNADVSAMIDRLRTSAAGLPFTRGKQIVTACWLGRDSRAAYKETVITPRMALKALR
jgi:AAA+ ATPase superfamily predicted ATPase